MRKILGAALGKPRPQERINFYPFWKRKPLLAAPAINPSRAAASGGAPRGLPS
jgi:hypothetical protein